MRTKYVKIDDFLELCGEYKNDENFINTLKGIKGIKEICCKEENIRIIILSPEKYSSLNLEEYSEKYGEVEK